MPPRPIPLKIMPFAFAFLGSILPVQSTSIGFFIAEKISRLRSLNSLCPVMIIAASESFSASKIDFSVL